MEALVTDKLTIQTVAQKARAKRQQISRQVIPLSSGSIMTVEETEKKLDKPAGGGRKKEESKISGVMRENKG
jgi:hypothetical protein